MGVFVLVFLAFVAILILMALFVGRNPVLTEFEARQRGIPVPEESAAERKRARARSDSTLRTALGIFGFLAGGLLVVALVIHVFWPEFTYLTIPIFVAIGVLVLFAIMWFDEQRIKVHYREIRVER